MSYLNISDVVHQYSRSVGTGAMVLTAFSGKQTFLQAGLQSFYYCISNRDEFEWEVGIGHLDGAGDLIRDSVISSSNSDSIVDFGNGFKDVTNCIPASVANNFVNTIGFIIDQDTENPASTFENALSDGYKNFVFKGNIEFEDTPSYEGNSDIIITGINSNLTVASGVTQFFNFKNTASSPVIVSFITSTTYDFSGQGVPDTATKITAAGHGLAVGDFFKIYSDDENAAQSNSGERKGEGLIVGAVSGNDIYVQRTLIETYSSGIKIVKPSLARLQIENLNLSYAGSDVVSGIGIEGYVSPFVRNNKIRGMRAPAINLIGVSYGHIFGNDIGKLANQSGQFGYCVNDTCGFRNRVIGNNFSDARHGYTNGSQTTSSGDDLWSRKGRTICSRVSDNVASFCNGAAIDTHAGSFGTEFENNTTFKTVRGYNGVGAGIQIRGERDTIISHISRDDNVGIAVTRSTGETGDNYISVKNCIIDGSDLPFQITGRTGNKLRVDLGGNSITNSRGSDFIRASFSQIYINEGFYEFSSAAPSAARFADLEEEAQIYFERFPIYDCQKSLQTNMTIAEFNHNSCRIEGQIKILEGSSSKVSSYVNFNNYDGYADIEVIKDNDSVSPGFSNIGASGVAWLKGRYEFTDNPAYDVVTYSTTGTKDLSIETDSDDVIFRRITTSASGVQINTITAGHHAGQILVIVNHNNSTHDLRVNNNSGGLLSLFASITIPIGRGLVLIWNGASWYSTAIGGNISSTSELGTDNLILRSDGTGRNIQTSNLSLDDSGNLSGLGAVSLTSIELGHASDTTLTRTGPGNLAIEGNTVYRAGGTDVAIADGGTGSSTAAGAFSNLKQNATTSATGVVELATDAEVAAGSDAVRAVTPATLKPKEFITIACSDETTAITAGTSKVTFRMPYAFTVSAVRASVNTAPTGSTIIIDINESGTSILSTKLSIDVSEKTSTTAASAAVISDPSLADDAEISIDFDQVGSTIAGAGVKVTLIGNRT